MRTAVSIVGVMVMGLFLAASAWTEQPRKNDKPHTGATCSLRISGMTCGGCAAAVKNTARKVEGVKTADVSYEKGSAEIAYDPTKTNPEAIAKAITARSGFRAEVVKKK